MTTINETFAAILKRHKTLFVTIVTILSIVGSIISILQAGSVKWSDAVIGMNILVWLIAVSVIQYNKLNKFRPPDLIPSQQNKKQELTYEAQSI